MSEQLFWETYNKRASKAAAATTITTATLPPWIAGMLPHLSAAGVTAVADVIALGTAFRAEIHAVAARKCQLKRARESLHQQRTVELDARINAAADGRHRHEFVCALREYRSEVESCRAEIGKLEASLSNNNDNSGDQREDASASVDPDKMLIDAAREVFIARCNDVMQNWKSLLVEEAPQAHQQQQQQPARPPWQLMYCAENDPFAPPSSDASKVTFDGGKIVDRFGRNIWEDRCVGLGITIQSGADGNGTPRYRSATHSLVTRSEKWHAWMTGVCGSLVIASSSSSISGDMSVRFNVCKNSNDNSDSRDCSCTISDPFADDYFVLCHGQRVMAFNDVLDAMDKGNREQQHDEDGDAAGANEENNNNKTTKGEDKNHEKCMQIAVLECLERFNNFPLVGYARSFADAGLLPLHLNSSTKQRRHDLSHLATFGDVERMAARFLIGLEALFTTTTTIATSDASSAPSPSFSPVRVIAACVEDGPEWFVMDVACAAAGILFVGMHTSWPKDDVARALDIISPDVVLYHQENAEQAASVKAALAMTQQKCKALPVELFEGAFLELRDKSSSSSASSSPIKTTLRQLVTTSPLFVHALNNPPFRCEPPQSDGSSNSSNADDDTRPFTLMFSSGTSGRLKAVEVSCHAWLSSNLTCQKYDLDPFSVVSFNAMAHGLDRGMCWTALFNAGRISYVPKQQQHHHHHDEETNFKPDDDDEEEEKAKQDQIVINVGKSDKLRLTEELSRLVSSGTVDVAASSFPPPSPAVLAVAASLIPDFIIASRTSDPSVLVAAPDAWTALKHALDLIGLTKLVESENVVVPTLKTAAASSSSSNDNNNRNDEDESAALLAKIRAAITLLFGHNVRQAGTGGAPVSSGVLSFYQRLFSLVQNPFEGLMRAAIADTKQLRNGPSSTEEDEKEPLGVTFVDVYGATEAPGISTNDTVRGGLEIALLPVAGYEVKEGFGELVVRGDGVARRYHAATAADNESAFLPGGWYRTGDVVHLVVIAVATAATSSASSNNAPFEQLYDLVPDFASQQPPAITAAVIKKSAISAVRLSVVDRVKDLVELYRDHQSAWVPSTLVEDTVLSYSKKRQQQQQRNQQNNRQAGAEIVQVAVFGDRMLPSLVAVVGVSQESIDASLLKTGEDVERDVLAQFREAMAEQHRPEFWVPKVLLLHRVVPSSFSTSGGNNNNIIRAAMKEWSNGSEFRTHLGKLRRGILAKELREELAAAFVQMS